MLKLIDSQYPKINSFIKNRLGPYKIVIKNSNGQYIYRNGVWVSSKDAAYDFLSFDFALRWSRNSLQFVKPEDNATIQLMTAAGDIELKEKDLVLNGISL